MTLKSSQWSKKHIYVDYDYPIVFVIIVVEGSPGYEDKDHGEDHEDNEDGAGVNIDRKNCQASKVARDWKSIKSVMTQLPDLLNLLVKTGIFASNMVG